MDVSSTLLESGGGPESGRGLLETGGALEFFALVAYLPEPLSGFLSGLRRDLDPRFKGKPHLTILPPRGLMRPWAEVWQELSGIIAASGSLHIELGGVRTFCESNVVYLGLNRGASEIADLHDRLNTGSAEAGELWEYCPHITLAHGYVGDHFEAAIDNARARWAAYGAPHSFEIERLTWVKTTIVPGVNDRGTRSLVASDSEWVDLAECSLATRVEA
jgi:2'-5' RNA ligase